MPADIQVNSVQCYSRSKMASDNSVLHEKLAGVAEAVCNYPCLYDKSSDDFKDANKKKFSWKDVAEAVGVNKSVSK